MSLIACCLLVGGLLAILAYVKLKLGICEDDPFTLATLSAAISFRDVDVVFSVSDPAEAVAEFKKFRPHAVLIDLHLGDGPTGLDVARAIRRQGPEVGIVFLTSFESPKLIEKNFTGVPSGSQYLTKRDVGSVEEILQAVQRSIAVERKTNVPESGKLTKLTKHQLSVLEILAKGGTNAEIAAQLEVDSKSVEPVIRRIAGRLGISSEQNKNQRIQMARAYLRGIGRLDEV